MSDLRKPFVDSLLRHDEPDNVFLTCDVGFSFLEPLKERMGDRFLNLGITENAAMAAAAGLAREGHKVFFYSMINFSLFRPYETLRNLIVMPNLDVNILGVKGSAAYAFLGYSHNMVDDDEDWNLLKKLPNVRCRFPETREKAISAAEFCLTNSGPKYIRL